MFDVALSREAAQSLGKTEKLVAGIRPEHFEDATLIGDRHTGGATFTAHVDVLESMGSELYVHFSVEGAAVDSDELRELAEDAGTTDVPGAADGRVVARLDAASKARQDQEIELWADTSRIKFFDAETGASLTPGS